MKNNNINDFCLYLYDNGVMRYWTYDKEPNLSTHLKYIKDTLGPVIVGDNGYQDFKTAADTLAEKAGVFLTDDGMWNVL
jgi:hypothetical protein